MQRLAVCPEKRQKFESCPPYPVYRISLPSKLSEHGRRIQQHNWGEEKEEKGRKHKH